ncbi:MAG: hypothetical protein O2854_07450, partial [Chloroflexi bacterium]|nr:hypothetical protein [Chloroflexota bacterium]
AVAAIRDAVPAASVTTDVICGFPGESDGMFTETFEVCEEVGFANMHVFPYSKRPGTSAAHFGSQLDSDTKRYRVTKLMELATRQTKVFKQGLVGQTRPVLWERGHQNRDKRIGRWAGFTDNYVRVSTNNPENLANEITDVVLVACNRDVMQGRVVED